MTGVVRHCQGTQQARRFEEGEKSIGKTLELELEGQDTGGHLFAVSSQARPALSVTYFYSEHIFGPRLFNSRLVVTRGMRIVKCTTDASET